MAIYRSSSSYENGPKMSACSSIKIRKPFTLVELLVVIAIISILAGMLLPALREGMNSAHKITCLSNQKQQYIALATYAGDYNGKLPNSPRHGFSLAYMSHADPWCSSFLAYSKYYVGVETTPVGDQDERTGDRKDILSCPGIAQHVPESTYIHTKAMVDYIFAIGAHSTKFMSLDRLASSGGAPKMISSDRVYYRTGSVHPAQSEYLVGHENEGGNVLSGDGSAQWGDLTVFDMFWTGYPGEGLALPVLKYYVFKGLASWNGNYSWFAPPNGSFVNEPGAPSLFF